MIILVSWSGLGYLLLMKFAAGCISQGDDNVADIADVKGVVFEWVVTFTFDCSTVHANDTKGIVSFLSSLTRNIKLIASRSNFYLTHFATSWLYLSKISFTY